MSRLRNVSSAMVVVIIAGLAGAAASAPARAAVTAGRIAYAQDGNIHTILPDGTGDRRLTATGDAYQPRWSPDGRRLAFVRHDDIYVMRANGTGVRRVTFSRKTTQPAWSPDGRYLAVVRRVGDHTDLYRIPVDGSSYPVRLTRIADRGCDIEHPTWRGRQIVFVRNCPEPGHSQNTQLWLLDVRSRAQSVVLDPTPNGGRVSWPNLTADGKIMFLGCVPAQPSECGPGRAVYDMNLDGTGLRGRVDAGGVDGDPTNTTAAPSPVGDGFVFEWSEPSDDDLTREGLTVCTVECRGILASNQHNIDQPDWQPLAR